MRRSSCSRRPRRLRRVLAVVLAQALLVGLGPAASASSPDVTLRQLAAVATEFSRELGVLQDPDALLDSDLSEGLAAGMSQALGVLLRCHRATRDAMPAVQTAWTQGLLTAGPGVAASRDVPAPEVVSCGGSVMAAIDGLTLEVEAARREDVLPPSPIDLWPVLRFEPGGTSQEYVHDYVLLVDAGGDDRYFNNAGGNAIDVKRGPSPAPIAGPARGCQTAAEAVQEQECVLSAAALLDLGGDDRYGRLEVPDPEVDAVCTSDPLVRRILVQGAGAVGVGVLVDRSGDDAYTGKVLTTGAGHLNGFGHLRDEGGDDTYAVIRIGEGAATVGGTGALVDRGGDDIFDFYIPAPLDPDAPNLSPGAGGVVDDQGRCDRGARLTLGAGNLGGVGLLENTGGDDSYTSSERGQGFGSGGFGAFVDSGGGTDRYEGAPGRANDVTLLPSSSNQGVFRDS